jgi:uncharacterized protein
MAVAYRELGNKALACIGVSPSYPKRELRDAIALAQQLGLPYRLVDTHEHLDPNYAANAGDRCYFCKSELHHCLRTIADSEGWGAIVDGIHADDTEDHRQGMTAAKEHGVRSPLLEAGLTKQDVREAARMLSLPAWDKPAMACLSSRIPRGVKVTPELLRQIEAAEDVLVAIGFRQFRVRHHGEIARVELPAEDLGRAVEHRAEMIDGIRRAGYRFVTLDLDGFRSGSLHDVAGVTTLTVKGGGAVISAE